MAIRTIAVRAMTIRAIAVGLVVLLSTLVGVSPAEAAGPQTVRDITLGENFTSGHADLLRLYTAFFNREPDLEGAQYWISQLDRGLTLDEVAEQFSISPEFALTYGSTTDEEFLTIVYANVLGRHYDQGGFDYWLGQIRDGLSRGEVVRWVGSSKEFRHAHPYPDPVGASPERVAPRGDRFEYVYFAGETWTGTFDGLVSVPLGEYNYGTGRCVLVTGTMTPTKLVGGRISTAFSTPNVGVIADGRFIPDSALDCDVTEAEALGHDWILHAEVTSGTEFPFYAEVFIPSSITGPITAAVIGDPRFDNAYYFSPEPVALGVAEPPSGVLDGPLRPVGEAFSHVGYDRSTWSGKVHGLVPAPHSRQSLVADGRCLLMVGSLTPTFVASGQLSNPFTTPKVGTVVAGELHKDDVDHCDWGAAKAAGYEWILNAQVTLGTEYAFFAEVYIPETRPGPIQAIVVGTETGRPEFFEAKMLDGFPP